MRAICSGIASHFPSTGYARQDFHCKSPTVSRRTQKAFDSKYRLTRTGSWKEGNKTWLGRETESSLSSPVPSPSRALSPPWALLNQSQSIPSLHTAGRVAYEAPALYVSAGGRHIVNKVSRKKEDCHSGITVPGVLFRPQILTASTKLPSRKTQN